MSEDDRSHLFVYGTLMNAATGALGARERRRLARGATIVGPAWVTGQLFDLGGYPGVVLADGARGAMVHGELVRLTDADAIFQWLDPYEDVSPGGGNPSDLYQRILTRATLVDGTRIGCWIYAMRRAPHGLKVLSNGRWQ